MKIEHPALQNLKFLHLFIFLRLIFALLELDPIRADQSQCGSESRSETLLTTIIFFEINFKKEHYKTVSVSENFSLKRVKTLPFLKSNSCAGIPGSCPVL